MNLQISIKLISEILAVARSAYPNECCGLIEGAKTENGWRALAVHETKNLAVDRRREFLIDPEVHFRLLRALRGGPRDIIGCFHSHPDGAPRPSKTDRAGANEDGLLWLIAASGVENSLRGFIYKHGDFHTVEIAASASGVTQPE